MVFKRYHIIILVGVILLTSLGLSAQNRVITGKVIDAENGSPIPFANVILQGTSIGGTTDFEGYYRIETTASADSLVVSYIGYKPLAKKLSQESEQIINFQITEDIVSLKEVVFYAGENPAYKILRNVVKNKPKNDKRSLEAYDYESYTKTEIDIDNISDYLQKRKVVKEISAIVDSIEVITGEDGKPVLPILISEALSRVYYKKTPRLRHERIQKTKVSGVGLTDATLVSQFIGSTLQEYNFYQNWLNIATKEFVSPIADGWKAYYDYDLVDSLYLGEEFCYRLDIYPKSSQDLAFRGTIWIAKESWALKRIDLNVDQTANLNYIEKIKLQQELIQTEAGPWMPSKTRIVYDVGEITNSMAGLLAKFYVSNKDIVVNNPYKNSFYRIPVQLEDNVRISTEDFWKTHRHDSLSTTEINVYQMVDTLNTIPKIKTTADLIKFAASGYHPVGKFDIGPYVTFLAFNNVEGLRLGFGGRTNIHFSDKWILDGIAGYGFGDKKWKYQAGVEYIFSRNPWTTLKVQSRKDIDRLFLVSNPVQSNGLFYAYSRFGDLRDPFETLTNKITFSSQVGTGINQSVYFSTGNYRPLFDFNYISGTDSTDQVLRSEMNTTELGLETRIAKDEIIAINDNERLSLGTIKWPIITLRYIIGLNDVLNGDFQYHKFGINIQKNQKMGIFGRGNIALSGEYILGQLPYPLLINHIGNESPFYIGFVSNLMNFSEFASDHFVRFRYRHHFEGFLLNRIPLLRKLKWRAVGNLNVIWGGMRNENLRLIPAEIDQNGNPVYPFKTLNETPYIEVGYGIENIFKIIRVDAFHRLTYLDDPNVNKFGVKISFQLIL